MNYERSIVIVPAYRHIEHETDAALRQLEKRGVRVERLFGGSAIDQVRSKAASWALTRPQGYEYIYWIDSDIHFEEEDFVNLAENGPLFSCLPYQSKMKEGNIAVLPLDGEEITEETSGWQEIRACGFGFVKTHRSIYDSLKMYPCYNVPGDAPVYPYFLPQVWMVDGRRCYYGEDFSFCLRAGLAGFKLKADFDSDIGHIGRYSFRIGD